MWFIRTVSNQGESEVDSMKGGNRLEMTSLYLNIRPE